MTPPSNKRYYVDINGRPFGPFDEEKIKSMLADGSLKSDAKLSTDKTVWKTPSELGLGAQTQSGPESSGAAEWYISPDGKEGFGVFTVKQIVDFLAADEATRDSLVWRKGESPRPISQEPAFTEALSRLRPARSPLAGGVSGDPAAAPVWFVEGDRRVVYGPYSSENLWELWTSKRVDEGAAVWRKGEPRRRMADVAPELDAALHPFSAIQPPERDPAEESQRVLEDLTELNRRLESRHWTAIFTNLAAAVFFLLTSAFVFYAFRFQYDSDFDLFWKECRNVFGAILVSFLFVNFLLTAAGVCCGMLFVHSFWSSIPKKFARTTPGKAACLLLVPGFNLYWFFVSFYGGAIDVNRALFECTVNDPNYGKGDNRPCAISLKRVVFFCVLACLASLVCVPWPYLLWSHPLFIRMYASAAQDLNNRRFAQSAQEAQ